jgi:histidyl-tRNA synthetase
MGIPFVEDRTLVRGLDYYTNTAFEVVAGGLGAQSSIGGGGRYDALVETCGGSETPGIGFGLGMERIILSLQAQGVKPPRKENRGVFVATLSGDSSESETKKALEILYLLRKNEFTADKDYLGRSLKAQMKYANKKGFKYAVIVGGEELERGCITLRNMETSEQQEAAVENITTVLLRWQGGNGCE